MVLTDFAIRHLFISRGHNFVGHHGRPPSSYPIEEVSGILCLAGRGIQGDRYLDHKENYKGQITFFEEEVYEDLCRRFGVWDRGPGVFRRNVITRCLQLHDLIGKEFEVQGVRFSGVEECRPCYWMDRAFARGAEAALKGRGGLRATILSDGILKATYVGEHDRTPDMAPPTPVNTPAAAVPDGRRIARDGVVAEGGIRALILRSRHLPDCSLS